MLSFSMSRPPLILAEGEWYTEYKDGPGEPIHLLFWRRSVPEQEVEDNSINTMPRPQPSTPDPSSQSRVLSPVTNFIKVRPDSCSRCGDTGHRRERCNRAPILFCSRCGRVGTLSRLCGCPPITTLQ
ncbi:unnamed protein product [Psylliodes chrysocephalus]|uniref:CCHC-type domain-containing protein n=1 Tax=Psylliodes chrysocephalus TaxID=3402493 RepID=A0A9P0GDF2_9CUCU|nr:unnamed protein product [Psylliodes chrysocephala]